MLMLAAVSFLHLKKKSHYPLAFHHFLTLSTPTIYHSMVICPLLFIEFLQTSISTLSIHSLSSLNLFTVSGLGIETGLCLKKVFCGFLDSDDLFCSLSFLHHRNFPTTFPTTFGNYLPTINLVLDPCRL